MTEHSENIGSFQHHSGTTDRTRLESLLRVALEQWPFKNEADREHERRLIERDMARLAILTD